MANQTVLGLVPKYNLTTSGAQTITTTQAAQLSTGEIASHLESGALFLKKRDLTMSRIGPFTLHGNAADSTGNLTLTTQQAFALTTQGLASLLGQGVNSTFSVGIATLTSTGIIPLSQLPSSVYGGLNYRGTVTVAASGTYSTLASDLTTAAPTPLNGDYVLFSVTGGDGRLVVSSASGGIAVGTVITTGDFAVYRSSGSFWDLIQGGKPDINNINGVTPDNSGTVTLGASQLPFALTTADLGAATTRGVASLDTTGILKLAQRPIASLTNLGDVKIGTGLAIDTTGLLSLSTSAAMSLASTAQIGGVLAPLSTQSGLQMTTTGALSLTADVIRVGDLLSGGTYA